MQIKKRIKKGFTLVELVVVIAVIAILAAVSIGAYFGITDSANRSADEQAVTQMNTMLETHEILNGKVDDVEEAKDIFEDNGLTNYTPFYGKNTFYWTYDDSRVIIWEEDKGVTFPSWAVDKYKDYNTVSADWYDITIDYSNHYKLGDDNSTISVTEFKSLLQNTTDNSTIICGQNSTYNDASPWNFYYLFQYLNEDVNTLCIDLNGSTFNISFGVTIGFENKTLILENGNINVKGNTNLFQVGSNSTLVLRNMKISSSNPSANCVYPDSAASEIIINNCDIEGFYYGVATNKQYSNYISINIKDSKIDALVPVMLNVPGTIKLDNSKLYGHLVAIFLRTGSMSVNNCYLWNEECDESSYRYYENWAQGIGYPDPTKLVYWHSGTNVPTCVAAIGDYSKNGTYGGDAIATFENTVFEGVNNGSVVTVPSLIAAADEDTKTTINYTSDCKINSEDIIIYDSNHELANNTVGQNKQTVTINGVVYHYPGSIY